ncbi:uncharacterized protein LOC141701064 [Apium graveolens]|uniref:uncharacterized protein LOC141701064 n=1 Tax=Apium graveolens TaxID=4045 RepID=UPI003D79711E
MTRSEETLEDMYAKLVIEDEDEGGLVVSNSEVVVQKQIAMRNVMVYLWRPKEGMEVHDMEDSRYSFVLYHKMDVQKIVDGGPWSFEQAMLVLHELAPTEDPSKVKLQYADIWVQIYDIPRGFLSENILRSVGDSMGKYIRAESKTFEGAWKPFVRIRVSMNIEKPLKRRLRIKREGDSWSWLNFKYERLGTFCFVCGILGHSERECSVVYANPDKHVEKAYEIWLKAPTRNVKNNSGAKWLRGEGSGSRTSFSTETPLNTKDAEKQMQERFMEVAGTVREINGDPEGMQIKSRDCRNQNNDDMILTAGDQLRGIKEVGEEIPDRDMVLIDAKRKRLNADIDGENVGRDGEILLENQVVMPKNVQMAGPLGFACCFSVDGESHGGGVALLWKHEGGVKIMGSCRNYIDFEVMHEQVGRWRYNGYYGFPERLRRREAWDMLKHLAGMSELPWCIIGDFNDLMTGDEKKGPVRHPRALLNGFSEAISECGLVDLGYNGDKFTWERFRGTDRWVQERLDRGMANNDWCEFFPNAEVIVHEMSTSDHVPIMLQLNKQVYLPKGRRFRFENMGIKEKECYNIIKDCWNEDVSIDIFDKMGRCCIRLEEWGGGLIKDLRKKLKLCRQEMQVLRARRDSVGVGRYGEVRYASTRKEHNKIKRLKDEHGVWQESDEEIQAIISKYFEQIFTRSDSGELIPDRIKFQSITEEQSHNLLVHVVEKEVKEAVFSMAPEKSPGVDGLNPAFFQTYWIIVGKDVVDFCAKFFENGELSNNVNSILVCLIPKVKHPKQVSDLRPISLCNVLMRILSKVMANRLKPCLSTIISEKQSAFIEGRLLTDNALVAFEINHYMRRKTQGKGGVAGLKVDVSKAYDRLEWHFIEAML